MKPTLLLLALAGALCAQDPNPTQKLQNNPTDTGGSQPIFRVNVVSRSTRAINYNHRQGSTKVDLRGTALLPEAKGEVKVESNTGATKLKVISRYLFYLAFENSNSVDYVSEKVFDGLIAGTVPVYLGAPNIDDYLPGNKCIIKAGDFGNAAELGKYLLSLEKNRKEYESYLAWKKEPLRKSFLDLIEPEKTPALRRLCYRLMEVRALK